MTAATSTRFPKWTIGLTGTRYLAATALHEGAEKAAGLDGLRRAIHVARDIGLDRDRIVAIVASACPDVDNGAVLAIVSEPLPRRVIGWEHRPKSYAEAYPVGANARPRIHKFAEVCEAFKVRIDDRTIRADDALESLAAIAAGAGFDYDAAATVAVATVIGPQPLERAGMTELRIGLAARMFEMGWPA